MTSYMKNRAFTLCSLAVVVSVVQAALRCCAVLELCCCSFPVLGSPLLAVLCGFGVLIVKSLCVAVQCPFKLLGFALLPYFDFFSGSGSAL